MTDENETSTDWKYRLRPRIQDINHTNLNQSGQVVEESVKVKEEEPDTHGLSTASQSAVKRAVYPKLKSKKANLKIHSKSELPVQGCIFDEIPPECDLPECTQHPNNDREVEISEKNMASGRLLERLESIHPRSLEEQIEMTATNDTLPDVAHKEIQGKESASSITEREKVEDLAYQCTTDLTGGLPEEDIRKDYTFTNGEWVLIAPQKLKRILEGMNPRRRVEYCWHPRNCQYASVLTGSRFTLPYSSTTEFKCAIIDFMLKHSETLAEAIETRFPNDTHEENWFNSTIKLLEDHDKVGYGDGYTLNILALLIRRNIKCYYIDMEYLDAIPGTHPIIQPEVLSGEDIYIVARMGDYYVYDERFKPLYQSSNHYSPIVPISKEMDTLFEIAKRVEKDLIFFIKEQHWVVDYMLFEFEIETDPQNEAKTQVTQPQKDKEFIKVSISPGKNGECEFNMCPVNHLSYMIEIRSTKKLIKDEQGNIEDKDTYLSITESVLKKCTLHDIGGTDSTTTEGIKLCFSLYEIDLAIWMLKTIATGRLYDQTTENELEQRMQQRSDI